MDSSEKSFRLFLLELSYLLKKLVDLKKLLKMSSSIDPRPKGASCRAVGPLSRAFKQAILMNQVSYFSHLQRHCFHRRTNQGKPRGGPATERYTSTSLQIDTTLIFENLHTDNQHPDGATRESFKRIIHENLSRGSSEMIIFTPSSELASEKL